MNVTSTVRLGLAGLACGLAALVGCNPPPEDADDPEPPGAVVDRDDFIPSGKYGRHEDPMVGVLQLDVRAIKANDHSYGPDDMLGFSTGGMSYRSVYAHDGDDKAFRTANAADAKRWGITVPYALVEAEAHRGFTFHDGEGFVAKKMKRLDGTADYPLDLPSVVSRLRDRYQGHIEVRRKKTDSEMEAVKKEVLKGRAVTGPKRADELMYLTWLPDSKRVKVAFRSRFHDAALEEVTFPLRYNHRRRGDPPAVGPNEIKVEQGVHFGVELGKAYEVDIKGNVVATHELPPKRFSEEIPLWKEDVPKD